MRRSLLILPAAALAAACSPSPSPPPTAPQPAMAVAPPQSARPAPAAAPREAPVAIPAGAVYGCALGSGDERRVTAIELAPRVAALCSKHPEMGPCQYEREGCRRSGGQVFAADGTEITAATEAEYDRKVARIRLRAD